MMLAILFERRAHEQEARQMADRGSDMGEDVDFELDLEQFVDVSDNVDEDMPGNED